MCALSMCELPGPLLPPRRRSLSSFSVCGMAAGTSAFTFLLRLQNSTTERDGGSGEAGKAVTFSYGRLQGVRPRPMGFPSCLPGSAHTQRRLCTHSGLALMQPMQDPLPLL